MGKRVRISNESLNCYGTRIITDGLDIDQYLRNPVLLYMHQRGNVIGYVKDIRKKDGEVTGELEFDKASEDSIRVAKQFEFGSLKMVSAGIDIIELSDSAEFLVPGQTGHTVTKSKLVEVSVVDIGGNDDALVLSKDGVRLELTKDGSSPLPLLNTNQTKSESMDLKEIALSLGLAAEADESAVKARIATLAKAETDAKSLLAEKDKMTLAAITRAVESGITEMRIPADKKEHFISLGKAVGLESLQETISAMTPQAKLSRILNTDGGSAPQEYQKLSDVPEDKLMALRKDDRETYIRLYQAEYGVVPSFEDE
jgi:hypothetical protein